MCALEKEWDQVCSYFCFSCVIEVSIAIIVMDGNNMVFILSVESGNNELAIVFNLPLIPHILFSKFIDFRIFVGVLKVGSHSALTLRPRMY